MTPRPSVRPGVKAILFLEAEVAVPVSVEP